MTQEGAHTNEPLFDNAPSIIEPVVQGDARQTVQHFTDATRLESLLNTLDETVAASLPIGSTVTTLIPYGFAYWSRTAAVKTVQEDGHCRDFFLKITQGEVGKSKLRGEYESMKTIYQAMPDFVPTPVAFGTYLSDPEVHFFLMQFVDMTDEIPGPDTLATKVAEMHRKCKSPNNKFGFIVPTNMGALIQPNTWDDSWETFFTRLIQRCFDFEQAMHGTTDEMQEMFKVVIQKVIPRLLRPLETGGNTIEPCFVHGNLWDGNTNTNAETNKPMIYDATGLYAHNEFELGPWYIDRHQIYRQYIMEYRNHFEVSQPEEDFEDRLRLYALRFNLTSSGCYLNNLRFREIVIEDMRYLTEKYSEGDAESGSREGEFV